MYYVPGTVLCDTTDVLRECLSEGWKKFISPYTLFPNVKFLGVNYSVYLAFDHLVSFYKNEEIKWDVEYFITISVWIVII